MADYTTTAGNLNALLLTLERNTVDTPYEIELDVSDVTGDFFTGSSNDTNLPNTLQGILRSNSNKFVSLSFGEDPNDVLNEHMLKWCTFYKVTNLVGIDISKFNATSISKYQLFETFNQCTALKRIDLSSLRDCIGLAYCFSACSSLEFANLHGLKNLHYVHHLFNGCTSLKDVDLTGCDSMGSDFEDEYRRADAKYMFYKCMSLETLDLPNMRFVGSLEGFVAKCTSLKEIHGWTAPPNVDYGVTDVASGSYSCFSGCTALQAIYVPEVTPTQSTWHAWNIKKDTANNRSTVTVYNPDGTSNSASVSSAGTYTMKVTDKVDELQFAPSESISSAMIQKMLQTKAPITTKEVLDPTKDNFVVWAKDRNSARTNVTTDTVNAGNKLPPTSEAVHAAISQIGLAMYPVGSIYMSVNSTNPKYIFGGDWEKLPDGAFIRNAGGNAGTVGQTQAEGLPNITGGWFGYTWDNGSPSGAITSSISNYNQVRSGDSNKNYVDYRFDASVNGTTLYGKSSHVTPYNYCVYMWRRKS